MVSGMEDKILTERGIEIEEINTKKLPTERKPTEKEIEREIKKSNDINSENGFNVWSMKKSQFRWLIIILSVSLAIAIVFGVLYLLSYQDKQYGSDINITSNTPVSVNTTNIVNNNISVTNPVYLNVSLNVDKMIISDIANEILKKINQTNHS